MEAFFAALRSGKSAIGPEPALRKWLPADLWSAHNDGPTLARVGDFGATAAIDASRRRRMPRLGQFCVVAAQQALGFDSSTLAESSSGSVLVPSPGSVIEHYGRERIGVVLGTGLGALESTLEFTVQYLKDGLGTASPALFPYTVMNAASALVAMELGLYGPNLTVNHRDLSFVEAVASACDLLSCGRLDAVLAGGADELDAWLLHAYACLGGLSTNGAMLPYDRHRQGFCPGEGAVLLLLERAEAARVRKARVLARIAGIGRHGDTRPRLGWRIESEVDGAARAIEDSLAQAAISPADIDFIAGSGNGTTLDAIETAMLRQALGPAQKHIPIASVLGQTGEWMTSAGVRLGAALYALCTQALPGTKCQEPDVDAALPGLCITPRPSATPIRHALIPTLAQGGGNVSLLLAAS